MCGCGRFAVLIGNHFTSASAHYQDWISRLIDAKDTNGKTAADLARNKNHTAIADKIDRAKFATVAPPPQATRVVVCACIGFSSNLGIIVHYSHVIHRQFTHAAQSTKVSVVCFDVS